VRLRRGGVIRLIRGPLPAPDAGGLPALPPGFGFVVNGGIYVTIGGDYVVVAVP
jgi:hypothetical protein